MSLYNITTLQGLGKAGEGKVDPIQFSEIKMDRKGLKSEADKAEVVAGGGEEMVVPDMMYCKNRSGAVTHTSIPTADQGTWTGNLRIFVS